MRIFTLFLLPIIQVFLATLPAITVAQAITSGPHWQPKTADRHEFGIIVAKIIFSDGKPKSLDLLFPVFRMRIEERVEKQDVEYEEKVHRINLDGTVQTLIVLYPVGERITRNSVPVEREGTMHVSIPWTEIETVKFHDRNNETIPLDVVQQRLLKPTHVLFTAKGPSSFDPFHFSLHRDDAVFIVGDPSVCKKFSKGMKAP